MSYIPLEFLILGSETLKNSWTDVDGKQQQKYHNFAFTYLWPKFSNSTTMNIGDKLQVFAVPVIFIHKN